MMKLNKQNFNVNNALWFLGVISFPFYFFSSGGAQVSTFLLLAASLGVILNIKLGSNSYIQAKHITLPLFFFLLYAYIITITWVIITKSFSILLFPVYYSFNILIFFCLIYKLIDNKEFIRVFSISTVISVYIQFVFSFVLTGASIRGSLFFNNPNQLGYYSLLSGCLLTLFVKRRYISATTYIASMICCVWLGQLSLSKAAMVSGILLMIYGTISNIRVQIIIIIISCFLYFILSDMSFSLDRLDVVINRLNTIGTSNDDNLEGRGYDRIFNHPEMLLLGASEGATYRWKSVISTHEIHSTWATILFSYGLLGTICWIYFVFNKIYLKKIYIAIPLITVFLYGITHNGLRFTLFWIFLAVIAYLSFHLKENNTLKYTN